MSSMEEDGNNSATTSSRKIVIDALHGHLFIWNANDVSLIRREYRIVGNLVGSLPRQPFQNSQLGLPLQLLAEEAMLLIEKGYAEVLVNKRLEGKPTKEEKELLHRLREDLYHQQSNLYRNERKQTIISMADRIVEGKRKRLLDKLQGKERKKKQKKSPSVETDKDDGSGNSTVIKELEELDKNAVIEEEIKKIPNFSADSCMVQIFTGCPWSTTEDLVKAEWIFPATEREKLRYHVFQDLWEKGHYLTSGIKFGCDFLAYPGDPLRYHALYIVVCILPSKHFTPMDLIVYGRLGTQVKKTVILASYSSDNTLQYISLKWRN